MALITSAQSGNFNDTATWTGGVVPGVGDEALASTGHTVTINVDTTCDEISNAGTGIFTLADGVTLTANVTHKSTTTNRHLLEFTAASPAAAAIVGNVLGATVSSSTAFGAIINKSSGSLTITGNVTGGAASLAMGVNNIASGHLTITGNVTGGNTASAFASANYGGGTLTITGNVVAGNAATSWGAYNASTGNVSIVGNVTATISAEGVRNNTTGRISITGTITATNSFHGMSASNTTGAIVTLSGSLISAPNGLAATNCAKFLMNPTPSTAFVRFAKNGTTTYSDFFTADNGLTQAAPADVRSGTVYADGNLTGTLAVPAAGSVALGVPVDNTTGTAVLTPAAVWDTLTSSLTTAGSIGERLKNAATVATTGEQLATALTAP